MRLIGVGEDVAADERCRRVGGTQEGLSMENSTDPRAEANRKVRARDQPYEIPYELLGRWRADYSGQPSQLIHFTSPHSQPFTAARPLSASSPLPSPHLTSPTTTTPHSQWTNSRSLPKPSRASRTSAPKTSRSSTSSSSARPRRHRFSPVCPGLHHCMNAPSRDWCLHVFVIFTC